MRASKRKYAEANPDKIKASALRNRYGITLEEYERLVHEQENLCAICRQPEKKRVRSGWGVDDGRTMTLAVDHDHATGRVRGLLCDACNRGLGFLGDDVGRLQAALTYLKG